MTPSVWDVPTAQAGGPTQLSTPESAVIQVGQSQRIHYLAERRGGVYRVTVARFRLAAVIESTEEGFVATCPQLETLGYGTDPPRAIADLVDATRDYLSLLAESNIPLSPRIVPHARYTPLLRVPPVVWFASVTSIPHSGSDAA